MSVGVTWGGAEGPWGEKNFCQLLVFLGGFEFLVYLLYLLLLRVVLGVLAQVVLERKYYRLVEMVAWCS